MAHPAVTVVSGRSGASAASAGADSFAERVMKTRDTVAKQYICVINGDNVPLITLRRHGDCTVDDPRACLNFHATGADLSCCMFVYVSLPQFDAMVLNNLIVNKTLVVLHCTVMNSYTFVQVQNREAEDDTCDDVETMIHKMKKEHGRCQPGVEMVRIEDYVFVQPTTLHRTKRQRRATTGDQRSSVAFTTSAVMSEKRFFRYVEANVQQFLCDRRKQDEQRKDLLCRPGVRQAPPATNTAVATLIISAAWMHFPETGVSRSMDPSAFRA